MPYTIKKKNGQYLIIKKTTGEIVGRSSSLAKARASIAYRESGDTKKR